MTVTKTTKRTTAGKADQRSERCAPRSMRNLEITVLAGGPSSERDVSLQSGQAVYEALCRLGHRATLCDVGPRDLAALDRPADFVFIALHGEFGEDGTIQAELDARGLCYAGSGAVASRLAMDKVASKECFLQHGMPTAPFVHLDNTSLSRLPSMVEPPAVVKPVSSGSSVDTTIARTKDSMLADAAAVVEKYGEVLVERYIAGPELTVAVLGDQALPVCEIRTPGEFYDYAAKYERDDTEYRFDIDLPVELLDSVRHQSIAAHEALGCEVFSRVDWMVDGATHEPYLLEVNTIPGFTSHSLVPKSAALVGLSFDELCQQIVELSLRRANIHADATSRQSVE